MAGTLNGHVNNVAWACTVAAARELGSECLPFARPDGPSVASVVQVNTLGMPEDYHPAVPAERQQVAFRVTARGLLLHEVSGATPIFPTAITPYTFVDTANRVCVPSWVEPTSAVRRFSGMYPVWSVTLAFDSEVEAERAAEMVEHAACSAGERVQHIMGEKFDDAANTAAADEASDKIWGDSLPLACSMYVLYQNVLDLDLGATEATASASATVQRQYLTVGLSQERRPTLFLAYHDSHQPDQEPNRVVHFSTVDLDNKFMEVYGSKLIFRRNRLVQGAKPLWIEILSFDSCGRAQAFYSLLQALLVGDVASRKEAAEQLQSMEYPRPWRESWFALEGPMAAKELARLEEVVRKLEDDWTTQQQRHAEEDVDYDATRRLEARAQVNRIKLLLEADAKALVDNPRESTDTCIYSN